MAEDTAGTGAAAGSESSVKKEPYSTTFFIFEASKDRRTWTFVGRVVARDRQQAERLYYGDAEVTEVEYCAVSDNAWQPRRRKMKRIPKPSYEDVPMPKPLAPAPVEELKREDHDSVVGSAGAGAAEELSLSGVPSP